MLFRSADDTLLQELNPRVLQFFREYFHYPFAREVFKDAPKGGKHEPGFYPVFLKALNDEGAVIRSRPNTLIVQ